MEGGLHTCLHPQVSICPVLLSGARTNRDVLEHHLPTGQGEGASGGAGLPRVGVELRIPGRNEAGEEAAPSSRRYSCLLLRIIVFSKENRSGGCYYRRLGERERERSSAGAGAARPLPAELWEKSQPG